MSKQPAKSWPAATNLKLLSLALCFLVGCSSGASETYVLEPNATIIRVVDGDTVEAEVGSKNERVRLIGIDTPETVHPTKPVECYGKEASDFTKKTLPKGTKVQLVLDAEDRDDFGRLLAYVYRSSDGMFVNNELASQGYAQVLTIAPNVAHSDDFVASARLARDANAGLWSACPASN